MLATVLPFGKHRGQPLDRVPSSYLRWLLTSCKLSSGLWAAVAGELTRRGIEPPPQPDPTWERSCPSCPGAELYCFWLEDSAGRKRVRAECQSCGRFLGHPPSRPPWSTMADAAASPTDLLDVLIELDTLGIELRSDGKRVWLSWPDEQRVSQRLRGLIRSCSHQLAGLLGKTERHCGQGTGSTERRDVGESDRD